MSRRVKSLDRQAEIVEITLALLKETPLASLSTRQIAKRLGISQPALFRHFRSREKLLLAVMQKARTDLSEIADSVLAAESAPLARLQRLAGALLEHVEANPGLARLLFAPPENGPLRDLLRALVSMQRSLISQLVRDGQECGVFRADLDPTTAAMYYVGMIQAIVLRGQLEDTKSLAQEAAPMLSLWLDGARATPSNDATTIKALSKPSVPTRNLFALDVRPLLSVGTDPLEQILAALQTIRPGGVLTVTAPFRPAPLLRLLTEKAHLVVPRQLGEHLWTVDIVIDGLCPIEELLDLEPPEPLERVLEAVASLKEEQTYLARLPRFPRLLVPRLAEHPIEFEVAEAADETALLYLRRLSS